MKLGQKAPDFTLKDKTGNVYSLESFGGDYLVVYFYPKDDTPGCTIEAQRFTEDKAKYKKLKIDVVGISGGTEKTKEKFCKKHNLDITLLSDPDFATAKLYNSFGEKKFMGRTYNGIFRNTFLLDRSREIKKIFENVSVEEHSNEVLEVVRSLNE